MCQFLQNGGCFSAIDILKSQGLSAKKCFTRSSIGQLCSAIVDRLTRGESICEDEIFDDVSCVNDAVEQLFDVLAVDDDMLTLTELHTLISSRHRSIREEDHGDHENEDDHNDLDGDHGADHHNDKEDDHDHDKEDDHHDHDDDNQVSLPHKLFTLTSRYRCSHAAILNDRLQNTGIYAI